MFGMCCTVASGTMEGVNSRRFYRAMALMFRKVGRRYADFRRCWARPLFHLLNLSFSVLFLRIFVIYSHFSQFPPVVSLI